MYPEKKTLSTYISTMAAQVGHKGGQHACAWQTLLIHIRTFSSHCTLHCWSKAALNSGYTCLVMFKQHGMHLSINSIGDVKSGAFAGQGSHVSRPDGQKAGTKAEARAGKRPKVGIAGSHHLLEPVCAWRLRRRAKTCRRQHKVNGRSSYAKRPMTLILSASTRPYVALGFS